MPTFHFPKLRHTAVVQVGALRNSEYPIFLLFSVLNCPVEISEFITASDAIANCGASNAACRVDISKAVTDVEKDVYQIDLIYKDSANDVKVHLFDADGKGDSV